MPASWRISRTVDGPPRTLRPSTIRSPPSMVSSALMQRSSVDLPEPEGPQITMRSPLATDRSMSRSTWK
eukprot:14210-Eustigmatos_ZCMA.PRE.1